VVPVADAHCHLADIEDPDGAVAEAAAAGVRLILAVAMSPEDGARVLDLKRRHPGVVLAGAGLHPSRVPAITDGEASVELALVAERAGIGGGEGADRGLSADFVGEIGLDYRDAPRAFDQRRQREILERLLDIAERARLPVNMHSRRADRDLVETASAFTRRTGLAALLHWFTHSRKLARRCGQAGIYISVGPSIEIDPDQARVAGAIAPDFLLVETDSPVEYAGRPARPSWAPRVVAALAAARGEEVESLAETLAANLRRFLGAKPPG
jgi:TatD DNase family protein